MNKTFLLINMNKNIIAIDIILNYKSILILHLGYGTQFLSFMYTKCHRKEKRMTKFEELPEGCIATILSRTTPIDVGKFSALSKIFRSVADSDDVWNRFLPFHISSILSQSASLANVPTKKALYLALSNRPIIVDHGQKVLFFINHLFLKY